MIDYNPTLSSSSFIGGELGILNLLEDFVENFALTVLDTADIAAANASSELYANARVHEEWADLTPYLNAYFDGDSFVFGVNPAAEYAAMELEYGSPSTPPKPVLRSTAINSSNSMSAYMTQALSKAVPSA
jgi:hypothetical protein